MLTTEYIATKHEDANSPWTKSQLLGDVVAAKSFLGITRGEFGFLYNFEPRAAREGDSDVDTFADHALLQMRVNNAAESVLRAEGILACAQRRYDRWVEEEAKRDAAASGERSLSDDQPWCDS